MEYTSCEAAAGALLRPAFAAVLTPLFGRERTETLLCAADALYPALIARTPYDGGAHAPNHHSLIQTAYCLAVYRAADGALSPARFETVLGDVFRACKPFAAQAAQTGRAMFTPEWQAMRRAECERSRENEFGFQLRFVDGDTDTHFGVDYLSCPICALLAREQATELAPHLCALDYVLADLMDFRLERTATLASGGDRCDFRYFKR